MLNSNVVLSEESRIHKKGLITTGFIPTGEVIWQLDPDELTFTLNEVKKWPREKQDYFYQFAFQCGENEFAFGSGIEKYMNHSCDPNTWWNGEKTLVACRDIRPGEEITYDYATADILLDYKMTCLCGSKDCRGVVTNNDYLNPFWQEKYGSHLPKHTLDAISAAGRREMFQFY